MITIKIRIRKRTFNTTFNHMAPTGRDKFERRIYPQLHWARWRIR